MQKVSITFDITNDCGLDAYAVMNNDNNIMISGLTDAIHKIASLVLNDNVNDTTTTNISSVKIDRVLDIETGCVSGNKCLFVSTISLVLNEEGDTDRLKNSVSNVFIARFKDRSFTAAAPESCACYF